ncbi:MAG TPA: CTP synthase (glutamine hydrolyzing) [Candidatus Aenigmarchaeota archaeon]|nr:MAG: CTP synthetase [Candidatus Aenigmarchaeota archaeon]HDD46049.1 CTP synthase (glutamine hydrolyzing) [Candidatus Aenigmarchaeota archaeon]
MPTRFIVVSGGVISGLGKGIFTASLAKLLQMRGYKVVPIKIDPYVNVDAGTMNPIEHGEVFVLDDGSEVDMDLGTYERFLDMNLRSENNLTTGKIYKLVIEKERKGDYLGKTVQIIPHITNEIQKWLERVAKLYRADIELIEIGGTVGDIENLIFLEATRQLALKYKVAFIHCTLVPVIKSVGEQKTKPTQQSVQRLREIGIQPDFIFCRSEKYLKEKAKKKISLFCGVKEDHIFSGPDITNIYKVPIILNKQRVAEKILKYLDLKPTRNEMGEYKKLVERFERSKKRVKIAITGKYTELHDSYVSILHAITHACMHLSLKPEIKWIETTDIENGKIRAERVLSDVNGVLVPGGFGSRGAEGKIECIRYARENNVPFLGLCFGFQLACIEFARNICKLRNANSTEIDPETKYPIIDLLPEQRKVYKKGGTMRLGGQDVIIKKGSMAYKLYGKVKIRERFRHRYEFNPEYKEIIEQGGLIFSGHDKSGEIMQILELAKHKFFIATQFHPEFTSRLMKPNPIFLGFVRAASKK